MGNLAFSDAWKTNSIVQEAHTMPGHLCTWRHYLILIDHMRELHKMLGLIKYQNVVHVSIFRNDRMIKRGEQTFSDSRSFAFLPANKLLL